MILLNSVFKKNYTIFKIGMKFTLSQFKKFNQCYSAYELIIQELCVTAHLYF